MEIKMLKYLLFLVPFNAYALDSYIQKIKHYSSTLNNTEEKVIELKSDLRPNKKYEEISILKKQLQWIDIDQLFDRNFSEYIKVLQRRKGLVQTGIIDQNTWLGIYTQPKAWQEEQIKNSVNNWNNILNQNVNSDIFAVVNIPSMELTLFRKKDGVSEPVFISDVIVGKVSSKTPFNNFNITHLKYNPNWTPTPNMLRKNVYRKDGSLNTKWIKSHGLTVRNNDGLVHDLDTIESHKDLKFTQPPGNNNALGLLKFETDSNENIYLHDTNERHLFDRNIRAYSSGCIRVKDYTGLASAITGFDEDTIEKEIEKGRTYFSKLETKIPVYFDNSRVRFFEDESIGYSTAIYK